MKTLLILTLFLTSCVALPDTMYIEGGRNPFATSAPNWEGDKYVAQVGVSWSLQPQQVVIAGQKTHHPWDIAAAMGVHDDEDTGPTPIVVEDQSSVEMAADVRKMTEAIESLKAEWDVINKTLLGGGGLAAFIAMIIGAKAAKKAVKHE